jgi:perosamine synthetase
MHTFGFPCRTAKISEICANWDIALIEDVAESLRSYVGNRYTGAFTSMATHVVTGRPN